MSEDQAYMNTDVHLWPPGPARDRDFYAPSCHGVPGTDRIGINVGGLVIVMPLRKWHAAAKAVYNNDVAVASDAGEPK